MRSDNFYRWEKEDLIVQVHTQPRAKRDEIAGVHDRALKIRIKAPPVDGKANDYLCRFLADQFGVSMRDIVLKSGEHDRKKRFQIHAPQKLPKEIPSR
ncbi:MAG: YggU family protein [Gammaproteobacteria bacterium GWE2_42_36]|nr:MAG: YggU family protein [Gammaproteobacteria bacterium GWE2_42_36]HCU05929.1 YggU family protein [Coxiellaceae bacterium]